MLALRFGDIDWTAQTITLCGETTKNGKTRQIPVGTLRLKAIFEWLRLDANGEEKSDDVPVVSNEVGEPMGSFRTSWKTAVLHAHQIDPEWQKGGTNAVTRNCQNRFKEINLHWHDLRHEYASRLVEKGVVLSLVQALLGHASILTTQRYDNQTFAALEAAAQRLESGKTFTSASHSQESDDQAKLEESDNFQQENGLGGGEGQNRTADTTIFSRMLYQLSYLATRKRA